MRNRFLLLFGIVIGSITLIFGAGYLTGAPISLQTSLQTTSDEKFRNTSSGCQLSAGYPAEIQQWCVLITEQAAATGLDPDLIAALIWQESGGNPQAYSRDGAVGLMQVMPRDGLAAEFMCPNGPCFANRPSMEELFQPDFNVAYGTQFLADLVNRHGSLRDALKYYGPANVGHDYADIVLSIYQNY